MSFIETIPVPKLKGLDHYNSWAIDCSNTFRLEGIWEITSGEDPKPKAPTVLQNPTSDQETLYNIRLLAHKESLKEWTKGNYRAKAYLMLYTEEGPRTHIEGMENACDMWRKLKELYSESHFQVLLSVIREMRKTHQSDYKTVLDYSEALKRLSRKCYNAKAPIPDWILTCMFLTGLEEDLEPYVLSLINSTSKEAPNIDSMAVALRDLSKEREDEEKSKSLTAKFGKKSSKHR